MANEPCRMIEPCVATATGGRPTTAVGLPDDLAAESAQRLSIFAAIGAGLWFYGLVMDTVLAPLTEFVSLTPRATAIEALCVAACLAMFVYVRRSSHPVEVKTDVGLAFMVLNAVAVALINSWARTPVMDRIGQLSWNTVVVLVSSMILATTPRKMMVASLVAASTDPAGIWLAHLRGVDVPSALDTMVFFAPNYACAVAAVLPAHIMQRVGRRLRHAREMGSYQLEELLGRGGMGEVWRGRHRLLARGAAIKLVRPELLGAGSPDDTRAMLRRFEREAQATAALSSPHTIHVFDYGVTADQTFYYVMELLNGRDLHSLVRQFGPLPADRVLYLMRQVCHSLAEAHARGLVHRDVTPANIYICRMGLEYDFVKVLDFGLVTSNDAGGVEATQTAGAHLTSGTPAYMAPEVIMEGAVDARADVYALGCVAYFLLTGELVFSAETPMKLFVKHLHSTPVRPSRRTELPIPRELDDIVMACLEKDPAMRPPNAEALLKRLDHVHSRTPWNATAAQTWWEQHLPELTRPLTIAPVPERPNTNVRTESASCRSLSSVHETMTPLDPAAFSA
jgi:serine/threonine-protein kinase